MIRGILRSAAGVQDILRVQRKDVINGAARDFQLRDAIRLEGFQFLLLLKSRSRERFEAGLLQEGDRLIFTGGGAACGQKHQGSSEQLEERCEMSCHE